MDIKTQRVVCSAIRAEDGDVLIGIRHYSADMIVQINARTDGEKFCHRDDKDQGFVDQFGNFLTREEAFSIAHRKNQIIDYVSCPNYRLYSEGLY